MTYSAVRIGRLHNSFGATAATNSDGPMCAIAFIARLKSNAHQVVVLPGTLPSNVASHTTNPTPKPGAYRPVATRIGSMTVWTPFRQRIGNRAAIWVPIARYRRTGRAVDVTGASPDPVQTMGPAYQAATSITMLEAMATATYSCAGRGR